MIREVPEVPEGPDFIVDWDALDAEFDWIRAMRGVPQDPTYHAEGDVWIHTRMVCEALTRLPSWRALDENDRRIVYLAALLHDVSKPACTREEGGRITSRGHSVKGELEARRILWRLGAPLVLRETVVRLVRVHQVPYFAIDHDDPRRTAIRVSQIARCDLLSMLCEADLRGRHCQDQQKLLDHVELFREVCREAGCFTESFRFASDHARFEYFRKKTRDPDYAAHDDTTFRVTLMSGLPAAGKDHWLATHEPDLPVVSLDQLRQELGIGPDRPQGPVVQTAKERAREHLRHRRPFAWNATNLSRKIRQPLLELFAGYGARTRIIYRDASPEQIETRNRARQNPVPADVIEKMLDRWEVPDVTEAHEVRWESGQR